MNESLVILFGVFLPFFGTVVGAFCVFFLKNTLSDSMKKLFFGFAAGVMIAASVWSLLIPSIQMANSVFPAVSGLLCGMGIFLVGDLFLSRAGKKAALGSGGRLMALAVTLHNIPEGMAVGVVFAGYLQNKHVTALAGAMVLSIGIAIQNFPEGAIISLPLSAVGTPKKKAFALGALSGAVEPVGAVLALLLTHYIAAILPYVLSFAAGAMLYVVTEELIPAVAQGKGFRMGCFAVGVGFSIMMALDVLLGG